MSPDLRVFASGHDRPLDIAGIEADLASLWKEASSAGKEPAMRASSTNLVVLVSGPDPATSGEGRVNSLLPMIARIYPARALVVRTGSPCEGGALCASVSALCSLGEGVRYVCCERISLDAAPGAEAYVPAAVLSLLLGELPVVVWIPGGEVPLAASWFRSVLDFTDRLVLDSSLLQVPSAAFRGLRHLMGAPRTLDIADFEWSRLAPWRREIAAAFDPTLPRQAAQEGFDRVTFLEPSLSASTGRLASTSGPQSVLADEDPGETTASAGSLLLRSWIAARVAVRSFAWAGIETMDEKDMPDAAVEAQGAKVSKGRNSSKGKRAAPEASRGTWVEPADPNAPVEPTRRIPHEIRFDGRASGAPFELRVRAPRAPAGLVPDDLARLIGGQPDNPMTLRATPGRSY